MMCLTSGGFDRYAIPRDALRGAMADLHPGSVRYCCVQAFLQARDHDARQCLPAVFGEPISRIQGWSIARNYAFRTKGSCVPRPPALSAKLLPPARVGAVGARPWSQSR